MPNQNKNPIEQFQAGFSEKRKVEFDAGQELEGVLKGDLEKTLETDDFEESQEALDKIKSLSEFRKKAKSSSCGFLYKLTEGLTKIDDSRFNQQQKSLLKKELANKLALSLQKSSPRIADFYKSLLSSIEDIDQKSQFEITDKKLKDFIDERGLEVLTDSRVSWQKKQELIEKRLEGYVKGVKALDYMDRHPSSAKATEGRETEKKNISPPGADEESKPGMDEMERNEGDEMPPAIWNIHPAYGGYYKQQSFDVWDGERNVWKSSGYQFEDLEIRENDGSPEEGEVIVVDAQIHTNKWVRVPIPYTHEISASDAANISIKKDQNGSGLIFIKNEENILKDVSLVLKKVRTAEEAKFVVSPKTEPPKMNFTLTEETLRAVEEIKKNKKGKLAQAYALASHTIRHLNYSNDSSFNSVYDSHENGYVGAIDIHRQADCDVGNTYFAGLCSLLDISVRHCVGHMVKGKDKEGNSRITSGTGHAWSEVYDDARRVWIRIDATPSGDPQLDEEQEKSDGVPVPGDYGEQEATGHTDEELEKLKEKLDKLTTELSYTIEERELAKGANIELKKAREIMKEIKEAEDIRLPGGERVRDVLVTVLDRIVEARKVHTVEYRGPLREREGGEEIEDVVAHMVGIKSKDFDPISRAKPYELKKTEKIFSGLDFIMIGDKSGSMSETVSGEEKWRVQRLAQFLIFSALAHLDQRCKTAGIEKQNALGVRTWGLSFRDSATIDEDKPLSDEFGAKEKLELWGSLGNQGVGNGDVAALSRVYKKVRDELEIKDSDDDKTIKEKVAGNTRLRVVVACSDGYPDDAAQVRMLAQKLGELGVLVIGIGMTETAKAVKTIFDNPPYSKGDYIEGINDLPMVVAEHVVEGATLLFPEKARENNREYLARVKQKFARK